jgi:hypothetical protein
MNGIRLARNGSVAVVAGIAAWSSYSHMVHVALRFCPMARIAFAAGAPDRSVGHLRRQLITGLEGLPFDASS